MYASISITVGLCTHIKINKIKHMLQFCFKKKMLYAAYPPAVFCSSHALQLRSQVLRQILMLYKLRVKRHFLKLSLLSVAVVVVVFFFSAQTGCF